jgi:hypothetical protein
MGPHGSNFQATSTASPLRTIGYYMARATAAAEICMRFEGNVYVESCKVCCTLRAFVDVFCMFGEGTQSKHITCLLSFEQFASRLHHIPVVSKECPVAKRVMPQITSVKYYSCIVQHPLRGAPGYVCMLDVLSMQLSVCASSLLEAQQAGMCR